jgi:hypothetical protein
MPGYQLSRRWGAYGPLTGALLLALAAGGCSGSSLLGGPSATGTTPASAAGAPAAAAAPSGPQWLRGDIAGFFSSSSDKAPQPVAGAAPDVECPYMQIREGASTLTIGAPGGENAAMSLKYQGTFVRAARQCAVAAGQMVMKVGVEGRIILGPAGGPGQIDVPLRIAVVDESPGGTKPIVTKLIHIPVTVASMTDNPSFAHVEEGLSFPLPSSAELEHYIVYIGFDPLAAQNQEKHVKPKAKPKHKPAPGTG